MFFEIKDLDFFQDKNKILGFFFSSEIIWNLKKKGKKKIGYIFELKRKIFQIYFTKQNKKLNFLSLKCDIFGK